MIFNFLFFDYFFFEIHEFAPSMRIFDFHHPAIGRLFALHCIASRLMPEVVDMPLLIFVVECDVIQKIDVGLMVAW